MNALPFDPALLAEILRLIGGGRADIQPDTAATPPPAAPAPPIATAANPWQDWNPPVYARTDCWRFVTTAELVAATYRLVGALPAEVSGICAVPTSGMIPASILATALHVPLYQLIDNRVEPIAGGWRSHSRQVDPAWPLVVVDDTVYAGFAMRRARAAIGDRPALFAAVFALPGSETAVDRFAEFLPCPHWLEWNLLNSGMICGDCINPAVTGCAVDFDGVLCEDPPRIFNETDPEDRAAYLRWIENARPRFVARHRPIPLVVSFRCEYTREATERWLARHRVRVERLELWNGPPESRDWTSAAVRRHKGEHFRRSRACLFIESHTSQAREIAAHSGKRVLSLEDRVIFGNP